MMKRTLFGACVMLVLLTSMSKAAEDRVLRMGVIPLESAKIMYKQFTPLAKYLSQELGMKVKVVVGKDYQTVMDALGQNDVQFAYLTPTTFPKCERQNPESQIQPIVRFQVKGKGTYRSCIIVPADSPIGNVEELKGKSFAFGNSNSTSSHLMPRAILVQNGIDIDKDLSEYKYLDSHTNVATAIKMKKYAGGGVKESVAEKFEKSGDVKIIARSKDIPEFPVCVSKHLDKNIRERLTQALLKLTSLAAAEDAAAKAVLTSINKKYTGCEVAKGQDYDTIREMIQSLYGDEFYRHPDRQVSKNTDGVR